MSSRDTVILLDHTHCRAICDEVGERLHYMLKLEEIPPHFRALIARLDEIECDAAPSIVPSIDEMDLAPRSTRKLLEPELS